MSCLEEENAKKKQNMMLPFVCYDGNNCYVADYLSNFTFIITVCALTASGSSRTTALVSRISSLQHCWR
jgi:hypothetical protein